MFGAFLFQIIVVGCSLSGNGTFGRPEAVLGDNGTFWRPEAALGDNGTFGRLEAVLGDIWASRSCAWGQRDIWTSRGCAWGYLGVPRLCLGTTGQATKNRICPIQNETYGHINHT
ncbi:hypothetical protein AVEN_41966-1 [Araneus ventricosus]|uniref:Secreted protein n=1 Tax=Araneus ventricosus TaxID=182803 RepID=A0A4Y2MWE7_ARAVE|nr:hypothetical protein AVEN_41966-1 [Araneus ventricosus]